MRFQSISKWILSIAMASSSGIAGATDDIRLGYPGYGGTGCPQGTASATLSPDQKELSVLFDAFVAEAGGVTGSRIGRKVCTISVPVHIPQGWSVSIIGVDYRGYVSVPRGGSGRLSTEYFFAGQRGPVFNEIFRGGTDDDYTVSHQLAAAAIIESGCGASVNLRVNTSMLVQSNARLDDALGTVDSADFSAGLLYRLSWRRCR